MNKPRAARSGQHGFALLVVFLMASAVAFTLYLEVPRVAFETAREREQLLMDRGNQYKRAIQVFYAVNKRYPAKIEDLENTNNVRFLRRRYKNPLNGKDEWRMVHTNGSFLTDSLVDKPPAQNGQPGQNGVLAGAGPLGINNLNTSPANGGATGTAANGTAANGQTQQPPAPLNAAAMARPSDRPTLQGQAAQSQFGGVPGQLPGGNTNFPGNANLPFGNAGGLTYDPSDPRTWPAITIATTPTGQNGQSAPGNLAGNLQAGLSANLANGTFNTGLNGGLNNGFAGAIQPGTPLNAINQTAANFQNTGIQNNGIPGQNPGFGGQNPQPVTLTGPAPNVDTSFGQGVNSIQTGNTPFNQPTNVTQPVPQLAPPDNSGGTPQASLPFGGPNPAASLIGSQLTNAAPTQNNASVLLPQGGVSNGTNGATGNNATAGGIAPLGGTGTPGNGTSGGPGIAGVASIVQGPSIKSYREHLKYQEWEFVYQPAQGQTGAPAQQNPLGTNGTANPNNPTANQNGGAPGATSSTSPFSISTGTTSSPTSTSPTSTMGATPNPFAPTQPQQ